MRALCTKGLIASLGRPKLLHLLLSIFEIVFRGGSGGGRSADAVTILRDLKRLPLLLLADGTTFAAAGGSQGALNLARSVIALQTEPTGSLFLFSPRCLSLPATCWL